MDDKELERLAQEELLQEAKRAQKRAEEMGPMGWQRCPLPATNKRFLRNVLVSTLEPRKKKPREEDTIQPRNQRKPTPRETLFRKKDSKTTSKHKSGEKDRKRSQKNSSHRSSHKRNTDRSPSSQYSSERQTNRID